MILAELLSSSASSPWIVSYHEHDSLLENRPEENLSEDERKTAWEEYEREKLGIYISSLNPPGNFPHSDNYTMQSLMMPGVAAGSQINVRRMVPYVPQPPRTRVTTASERPRVFAESEFNEYPVSTFLTGDELQLASKCCTVLLVVCCCVGSL